MKTKGRILVTRISQKKPYFWANGLPMICVWGLSELMGKDYMKNLELLVLFSYSRLPGYTLLQLAPCGPTDPCMGVNNPKTDTHKRLSCFLVDQLQLQPGNIWVQIRKVR